MRTWLCLLVVALLLPVSARAGDDGKEEGVSPGEKPKKENPLKKISELMRDVEERLAEMEVGNETLTQEEKVRRLLEEQEKLKEQMKEATEKESEVTRSIEDAMKEQERVVGELEKLIRQAEQSP